MNREPLDIKLFHKVTAKVKDDYCVMGSKWQNCEAEVIVAQTVRACKTNFEKHGEALSWVGKSVFTGRQRDGTHNYRGLKLIGDDLIMEAYDGKLTPPDDTAVDDEGKPLVFRLTNCLLHYLMSHVK